MRTRQSCRRVGLVDGRIVGNPGTLQGAGGVGGLRYLTINGAIYIPFYDANGNITHYCDENGMVVAQYTYDAFGRTIAQSGPMADSFHHRFSTKYLDPETGLYYYVYAFTVPSSNAGSTATRSVKTLDHVWHDEYDWHNGLAAFVPEFGIVEDMDAQYLEDNGKAKSFEMEAEWTQSLKGQYEIGMKIWGKSHFEWGSPNEGNTGVRATYGRTTSTAIRTL